MPQMNPKAFESFITELSEPNLPDWWLSILDPPQSDDELGRFGEYRVLRKIGVGGYGVVFAAEEASLGRTVALKVLRPDAADDPVAHKRFHREARAMAEIDSEYVVKVFRVGEFKNAAFLTMPLLHGGSLQSHIKSQAGINLRTILKTARDTARGLKAIHAHGLVHRDIKPANIWIEAESDGAFKRALILDFGLARRTKQNQTHPTQGEIIGTVDYMSPEQAKTGEWDHRTDLYSLGAVLYTAVTGQRPFQGRFAPAILIALVTKTPEPVHIKNPGVPRPLSDLIERLMRKAPEERIQTAEEVENALEQMLEDLDGAASPTASYREAQIQTPPPQVIAETIPPPPRLRTPTPVTTSPAPIPSTPVAAPHSIATVVAPVPTPATLDAPASSTSESPQPESTKSRIHPLRWIAGLTAMAAMWTAAGFSLSLFFRAPRLPIIIGVLHSQTGPLAMSEQPLIDAEQMAVNEINDAGGVLGRPLKMVVTDCKSDTDEYTRQAEWLLEDQHASALFGCWSSSSRKAVSAVVERRAGVLVLGVFGGCLGQSPRIVYLGATPNQQLLPAVDFIIDGIKKHRVAVVGGDGIFTRAAEAMLRDHILERRKKGADIELVRAVYAPTGSTMDEVMRDLSANHVEVVVNLLSGTDNIAFFEKLRDPKRSLPNVTTISVCITESDLHKLSPPALSDDYMVAGYFESFDKQENKNFLQKIHAKYGEEHAATDRMAAAYGGVHLWARATKTAGSIDPDEILKAVRGLSISEPRGRVTIDPETRHAWLPVRIGKIRPNGEVALVSGFGSTDPIRPVPFPDNRSRAEWTQFLQEWRQTWGGNWESTKVKR